jgi:hypothetical protein
MHGFQRIALKKLEQDRKGAFVMKKTIFVAGPVHRLGGPQLPQWVSYCYECIEVASKEVGVFADRPKSEPALDSAPPAEFQKLLRKRIIDSSAVVAVFLPNDPSVPAEILIAAENNKQIMIIHQGQTKLPRILPGITIQETSDLRYMIGQITNFLREV